MEKLGNTNNLTQANRMIYASTFVTGNAEVWCTKVPDTCEIFKNAVVRVFFPPDYVSRSRDKLRKIKHVTSVLKYLTEFRSLVLTIHHIADGENMYKFRSGLKYEIRVEELKAAAVNVHEKASSAVLRIDSAIGDFKRTKDYY